METPATIKDERMAAPDSSCRGRMAMNILAVLFFAGISMGSNFLHLQRFNEAMKNYLSNNEHSSGDLTRTKRQYEEVFPMHDAKGKIKTPMRLQYEEIQEWTFKPALPPANTEEDGYFYRNRSEMSYEFNSTVQFIFTVGLEGTGHHLMGVIAENSPAISRLRELQIWNGKARTLQLLLYNDMGGKHAINNTPGIWNAHCVPDVSTTLLEKRLVEQLRIIDLQAENMSQHSKLKPPFPYPINTVTAVGARLFGEVSYPNFEGICRLLNYPDLNLLYNACRKAKVDCMHVYIHRHPLEVLNSIVKRGFDKNDTSTMQIYIADLHVIANQIRMYASKTLGCFAFFSQDPKEKYWIEAQKDLWAWDNATEHKIFIDSIYQPPERSALPIEKQLQWWLAHSKHAPYVQSLWKSHQHAIQTCREAVKVSAIQRISNR